MKHKIITLGNFFIISITILFLILLLVSKDVVGCLSIYLVSLLILKFQLKFTMPINLILCVALLTRLIVILIGELVTLPDSNGDAITFYLKASELSQKNFLSIIKLYPGAHSSFFPWMFALLFSILGESKLMAKSIILLFGVGTIYFCWLTLCKIYNTKIAARACWILVFFPSLVLYSTLFLREVYVYFFLSLALYGIAGFIQNENLKSLFLAIIAFTAGGFFHGLMFLGLIFFIFLISIIFLKKIIIQFLSFHISQRKIIILIFSFIFFSYYLTDKIGFAKIGKFSNLLQQERIIKYVNRANRGDASYPQWTKFNSVNELIFKLPAKSIYFLISPFPLGVKKLEHLIAFFDGFLFFILIILILKNSKFILSHKIQLIFLSILILYSLALGFGVGNFGTGIRHRAKLLILFIMLIAPMIPGIVISKKKS